MIGGRSHSRYFRFLVVLGLVLSIMATAHGMARAGLAACLNSAGASSRALSPESCDCCGGKQAPSAASCCAVTGMQDSGDQLFVSSTPGIESVTLNSGAGAYESVTPVAFSKTDSPSTPLVRQTIYLSNLNLLR